MKLSVSSMILLGATAMFFDAAPAAADPASRELSYFFAVAGGTPGFETPAERRDAEAFGDGEILTLPQLLGSPASSAPETSLFVDAELLIHLMDGRGNVVAIDRLARCKSIDLYLLPVEIPREGASCDGKGFTVRASASGILVLAGADIVRDYRLLPGTYSINGLPFLVR